MVGLALRFWWWPLMLWALSACRDPNQVLRCEWNADCFDGERCCGGVCRRESECDTSFGPSDNDPAEDPPLDDPPMMSEPPADTPDAEAEPPMSTWQMPNAPRDGGMDAAVGPSDSGVMDAAVDEGDAAAEAGAPEPPPFVAPPLGMLNCTPGLAPPEIELPACDQWERTGGWSCSPDGEVGIGLFALEALNGSELGAPDTARSGPLTLSGCDKVHVDLWDSYRLDGMWIFVTLVPEQSLFPDVVLFSTGSTADNLIVQRDASSPRYTVDAAQFVPGQAYRLQLTFAPACPDCGPASPPFVADWALDRVRITAE